MMLAVGRCQDEPVHRATRSLPQLLLLWEKGTVGEDGRVWPGAGRLCELRCGCGCGEGAGEEIRRSGPVKRLACLALIWTAMC